MVKYIWAPLLIILLSCFGENLSPYQKEIEIFRNKHQQGLINEDRSPLERSDLKNVNYFNVDSNFVITASYTLIQNSSPVDFPTSSGKKKSYRQFARLDFQIQGVKEELYVYESMALKDKEEYKNYLFLPFTDFTSGEQSYGGGRYIDLNRNDFSGNKVIIDFNKCYNPWCAYSDGFNCPVPPRENDLEIKITAGERNYSGEYKLIPRNAGNN